MALGELYLDNFSIVYREDTGPAPLAMRPHYHNQHEVILSLEGEVEHQISGKICAVHGSAILFLTNLERHSNLVTRTPYRRYFMMFSDQFVNSQIALYGPRLYSMFKTNPASHSPLIQLEPTDTPELESICRRLLHETQSKREYYQVNIAMLLNQMFILLLRNYGSCFPAAHTDPFSETVSAAQRYVDGHFTEDITLKSVAELLYTDMYYLSTKFKQITGYTFKDYLTGQRLAMAKEQLLHTGKSVEQICFDCGFHDVSHFIRVFRARETVTPHKYRQGH